ncbi:MAG: flavin oxidoreductase/NADH oxidase, partial [Clostridia bacterium]|nr:flavin oxidoreductase/NADH oxidase [Clostridia bacterium]
MGKYSSEISEKGYNIPLSENLSVLSDAVELKNKTIRNRFVIQPMEGCDGTSVGAIDELTHRRYTRFARSGAGLIWFEAVAILNEARANPRQLYLNEKTLDSFKREVESIRETAVKTTGVAPVIIMQATHSGRYSKPNGFPEPIIALNKPPYEKDKPIDKSRIVTDDYLKALEEEYGKASALAEKAGFDGVDIKCCHGYLMSELMGAHVREGKYGGSFENRTRLFFNAIENAKASTSENFIVTSRMNAYDGFLYPYGFGVSEEMGITPDLREPLEVVRILTEKY